MAASTWHDPWRERVPRDAEGRLDDDAPCRRCGYNLRGLALDGLCPECGAPVAWSAFGAALRYGDPRWIATLASGMGWLVAGLILSFLSHWIVPRWFFGDLVASQWGWSLTAASGALAIAVVMLIGVWRVTAPEPGTIEHASLNARTVGRWSLTTSEAITVAAPLLFAIDPLVTAAQTLQYVGKVAWITGLIALLAYLTPRAERLGDSSLARQTFLLRRAFVVLIVISVVLIAIAASVDGLGYRTVDLQAVFGDVGAGIAGLAACGGGLATLAVNIWLVVLLVWYRRRLSAAMR